jgi:hypothetical protein
MSANPESFVCKTCGKSHEGHPTDRGFTLPDDVWAIPEEEREAAAKFTSDLCQLDERYFIRCLLPVPFKEREGYYGWGVWAEVSWPIFQRYLEIYEEDATGEPSVQGKLANQVPVYEPTVGLPVVIKFGISSQRPTLQFPAGANHQFALEQSQGMSEVRYHEVLERTGSI